MVQNMAREVKEAVGRSKGLERQIRATVVPSAKPPVCSVQCSAVQCSAAGQCSAVQCSVAQLGSAVQCRAVSDLHRSQYECSVV